MVHAAPAASQSSDSTPRALSWDVRTDDADSGFIVNGALLRRGHYTDRPVRGQDQCTARDLGLIEVETCSESTLDQPAPVVARLKRQKARRDASAGPSRCY